jgi:hypothetical protein
MQVLESGEGGDQVGGPCPAGWDLEDGAAGVLDVAGRGAEESVAQGFLAPRGATSHSRQSREEREECSWA